MKKMQLGESKAHRFFSGKGFYVALAVSLVAVGGAAWLGVNSAINNLESDQGNPPAENNTAIGGDEWSLPSDFEANVPQNDVPAESRPESQVTSEPATPTEAPAAVAAQSAQGYILPIKGEILNAYSGDKVVKSKTLDDWVMHTGVDISSEIGTPVKAMSGGTVLKVENDDLWGTTVTIEHSNGYISWYANLKPAVNVKEGQAVKLGDVIGTVGDTAGIERAESSHLHFGVKQNEEWIDPAVLCK